MKKMIFARRVIRVVCAAAVLFCFLLAGLYAAATDTGFHLTLYRKYGAEEASGLTWQGVQRAAKAMTDCLKTGKTDMLSYEDEVYGKTVPVFNGREIDHMKDVSFLFVLLKRVGLTTLSAALILAFWCRGNASDWGRALLWGTAVWLILLGILAGVCLADFNRAFIAFHHLFFRNDLWLMNPETDLMIRMLPEPFFSEAAARAATISLSGPILAVIAGTLLIFRERRKHKA